MLLNKAAYFLLFNLVLSTVAHGQIGATADSYESYSNVLKAKNYQLKLSNAWFGTTAYYDYDGNKQNVGSLDNYSRMETELSYRRFMAKNFEGTLFGRYRMQSSDETDSTGVVRGNSASGIESVGFILRHAFPPVDKIRYTLEGGARIVTYKNNEFDPAQPYKEIVLGDGVNEIFAGGSVSYETSSKNVLSGRLHLNYPTSKQSAELKYDTHFAFVWTKLAFLGGLHGIYSLNQDKYSDNPASKPRVHTGATRMYNSVNRAYLAPYVGLNWGVTNKWRVESKAASIVAANSYDQGSEYTVSLVYNTDRADNTRAIEKDDKFKNYNIEASVVKVSPRGKFVRIDKGLAQDVEKGMKADVFDFDYLGGNKLLASGVVMEVTADAAVIKIFEIYGKAEIRTGHVVRLQEL